MKDALLLVLITFCTIAAMLGSAILAISCLIILTTSGHPIQAFLALAFFMMLGVVLPVFLMELYNRL